MKFMKLLVLGLSALSFAGFAAIACAKAEAKIERTVKDLSIGVHYPEQVLELFTSQGCSSCPPANKFVGSLRDDPNILTLSYSVDYWDYLGWKDTFGKPEFTRQQRHYGTHFQGQIYTPQMVINGKEHGSRMSRSKLRKLGRFTPKTLLSLSKNDTDIDINIDGMAGSVMAVYYVPGQMSVPVKRGENHGRTLELSNVVTECTEIFARKKAGTYKFSAAIPPQGKALAILVHSERGGPILAAATYAP